MNYILTIDQGTSSSRAIIFHPNGQAVSSHQVPISTSYPQPGWVEQDPEEMFQACLLCCKKALEKADLNANHIIGIGITNQRETTVIWDRTSGKAVYPAIVWQDRRTINVCQDLKLRLLEKTVHDKTGLILDPYFSSTKIRWILDHIENGQELAETGKLAFGTLDSYLLWRFTDGKNHATDATNASRTQLLNLETLTWDADLLELFKIPRAILPEVAPNTYEFGYSSKHWLGETIPILAMIGDQQSAAIGQACILPGETKATFGTGLFILQNTGTQILLNHQGLLTTLGYALPTQKTYALEGSAFMASASLDWLSHQLNFFQSPAELLPLLQEASNNHEVYLIPAFTGLGAPYWQPDAKACIFGLTRDTSKATLVRSAVESVAFQAFELLKLFADASRHPLVQLKVDGGLTHNSWLMQYLSELAQLEIYQPSFHEMTAWGAAFLAGLQAGLYSKIEDCIGLWPKAQIYQPTQNLYVEYQNQYNRWLKALSALLYYTNTDH